MAGHSRSSVTRKMISKGIYLIIVCITIVKTLMCHFYLQVGHTVTLSLHQFSHTVFESGKYITCILLHKCMALWFHQPYLEYIYFVFSVLGNEELNQLFLCFIPHPDTLSLKHYYCLGRVQSQSLKCLTFSPFYEIPGRENINNIN